MLDKDLYNSWKSIIELYMQNKEHGRMILESVKNGPLIWPTIKENGMTITKKYVELSVVEKIQADCDMKATNVILQGDDPIACLNKAMDFLTAVASSRFPSTNNQLITSSNIRNQAIIQDGSVIVQQVQGRQGEGHMARKFTQPKQLRNVAWYKDKAMLADAQEVGQILDKEQLAFLADPGVPDSQAIQTIILNNAAFQTKDLYTYDSDCDDVSNAKAVFMANIFNYGFDIISEVQKDSMILSVIKQMSEQMINHVNNWEKANKEQNNESVTAELEGYKERVETFEQRLNIDLSSRKKIIDSQMDDMIKEKLALKEQVDSLEKNLSNQIKEKKCLLQTLTVFKSESKEKEDKYMENEINLEKKIKELDNTIFKVEAPKELSKVSLVNESLKKLKLHLANFDKVVKIRTTPNARTAGEWGFKHTKAIFNNEIIPFLKSLKDIFNVFDLLNEIIEVQTAFDQMNVVIQQSSVDKQCLEIAKKELLLEIDRLLQQSMSRDIILTVMNYISLIGESVNMERKQNESCDKCFDLDVELLKSQNAQNDLLKREAHIDYLKYTQEQVDILWGIVKQAKVKQPLDNALDFVCCPACSLVSGLRMFKTHDRELLSVMNFVSKFLGTDRFRNDHIARIMRYGDCQLGNVTISRVYYVEGLGHNLFSVGQFYNVDLEVSF
nr:integrase, catalytic region, zinc finger, CCHC-type, peptidase aspartic, catalytic [Tanacetum cinerariifolium]